MPTALSISAGEIILEYGTQQRFGRCVILKRFRLFISVFLPAALLIDRSMLITACGRQEVMIQITSRFDFVQQCQSPDGSMWCLIYLEKESPTALASLLKEKSFDVHVAPDMDDLLDALWYHGSAVGRIVIEASASKGFEEFLAALEDWPDLDVLVFGPDLGSVARENRKHRFEQAYSLQSVSHWLGNSLPGALGGAGPAR